VISSTLQRMFVEMWVWVSLCVPVDSLSSSYPPPYLPPPQPIPSQLAGTAITQSLQHDSQTPKQSRQGEYTSKPTRRAALIIA
jgi:hypothetical protein